MRLPEVRTASYAIVARTVLAWGGIGEDHEPEESLVALDVDKRVSRAIKTPRPRPAARGGAISVNVAPNTALLVCGSDHNDEISSMLTPFLLRVPLPEAEPAAAASVS